MINQRAIRTVNFLITHAGIPWTWGTWDCNLFITRYLDHMDGGSRSELIQHKYKNLRTAVRFQKSIPTAPEWVALQGYEIITTSAVKDYDIVLEPAAGYWSAGLAFDKNIWSVEIDRGTVIQPIEAQTYMVGRQNG